MKSLNRIPALMLAAVSLPLQVTGCGVVQPRAMEARGDYETAMAAGDVDAARLALLKLLAAEDSVPDDWIELGRLQLSQGEYGDAYYAFTRAYELDRTNVDVLAVLTQLALFGQNSDEAAIRARQLELLAPDHPAVQLATGYSRLRRNDFEVANQLVDSVLANSPFDTAANILKVRILIAQGQRQAAIGLLENQTRVKRTDVAALKALVALNERDQDWAAVASAARRLMGAKPDKESALIYIRAAYRAGAPAEATLVSRQLLQPDRDPAAVREVLEVWVEERKDKAAIQEAWQLAGRAGADQQLAYATYFNRVGDPAKALALLGNRPRYPVTRLNSGVNSLIAESLHLLGHQDDASRLLDSVLALEPDHVHALRARAELRIRTGNPKGAIRDAQRLVSILPESVEDRLQLARAYKAAGDARQFDRVLWNAFHELRGQPLIYAALRAHVEASRGSDATLSLAREFEQQLDSVLSRNLV